jgi:hypothetical protein
MASGDHDVDEQVEASDQLSADKLARQVRERLEVQVTVDRPSPRVGDHKAVEPVRAAFGGGQPDLTATCSSGW